METNAKMMTRARTVSHKLGTLLRHKAVEERLNIKADGFVRANEILVSKFMQDFDVTMSDLDLVKEIDGVYDKQRFDFRRVNGVRRIRALAGRLIKKVQGEELRHEEARPEEIVGAQHGTVGPNVESIKCHGLGSTLGCPFF